MPGPLAIEGARGLEREIVALPGGDDLHAHRQAAARQADAHRRRGRFTTSSDQQVWVGTTETLNPKDVPELVDGVATAVAADMREHGLLPARAD